MKKNAIKQINKAIKSLEKIKDNREVTSVYITYDHINTFLISLYTLKNVIKKQN
jgi:hypothetical protein